ncbi:hypothetical protein [Planctobacterium marinum]|uniref:hypothetical protein n=1 Tax=Planctobacterium marinum TaxID=1631968 RepID=UPI0030C73E8F
MSQQKSGQQQSLKQHALKKHALSKHYVVGYGSLMSHDSRLRYSQIDAEGIPVHVTGWQRSWNMNCPDNRYTCVGALPGGQTETLNAMLVPVAEITPALQQREQSYQFTQLDLASIQAHNAEQDAELHAQLNDAVVWICQVEQPGTASTNFPIFQTYVDTCLSGCLQHVGVDFAMHFIERTRGWQGHWVNDRHEPRYPRLAALDSDMHLRIDELLEQAGLLQFRQESP